jgi:acyl carrier protein
MGRPAPAERGQVALPVRRRVWYRTPSAGAGAAVQRPPAASHWEECIVATVEERVIQIVCDNLGVSKEQVTRNTSFQEDVGADSLDIVELVMELEEEFEITIPDEEAEKIKTVGEAIDYIEKELEKKKGNA